MEGIVAIFTQAETTMQAVLTPLGIIVVIMAGLGLIFSRRHWDTLGYPLVGLGIAGMAATIAGTLIGGGG